MKFQQALRRIARLSPKKKAAAACFAVLFALVVVAAYARNPWLLGLLVVFVRSRAGLSGRCAWTDFSGRPGGRPVLALSTPRHFGGPDEAGRAGLVGEDVQNSQCADWFSGSQSFGLWMAATSW